MRTPSENACIIKYGQELHCACSRLAQTAMRRDRDCLMRSHLHILRNAIKMSEFRGLNYILVDILIKIKKFQSEINLKVQ